MTVDGSIANNKKICEVCNSDKTNKNLLGCDQWYGIRSGHRYCYRCYHKIVKPSKCPKIYCKCGCGELIPAFNRNGKPARFKNYHHNYRENHYRWKGGRIKHDLGYIMVLRRDHHFANNLGHVFEHRLVYEEYYKCSLLPWVHIHHINGIKDDNRIENLQAMSPSDHGRREATLQWKTRKRN